MDGAELIRGLEDGIYGHRASSPGALYPARERSLVCQLLYKSGGGFGLVRVLLPSFWVLIYEWRPGFLVQAQAWSG